MKIGVLALQGDFAEHAAMLDAVGVEPVEVRLPAHLDGLRGLCLPGGESTTMRNDPVHGSSTVVSQGGAWPGMRQGG